MTAILRDQRCQHYLHQRLTGPHGDTRLHVHHRQRRAVGPDTAPNLVLLCSTCHAYVHRHPRESRDLGYIVSAHVAAGRIRDQRMWSRTWDSWVLLNDDWTVTLAEGERPWLEPVK